MPRRPARLYQQIAQPVLRQDMTPEAVSIDRFQQPFYERPRLNLRASLHPAHLQQETAYGRAAPFFEESTMDKWYPALNEPIRISKRTSQMRPHLQQETAYGRADPFGEDVKIDRYLFPLNEPKRFRRGLRPDLNDFLTFYVGESVNHMAFFNWLAEPRRFLHSLPATAQQVYASAVDPIIPLEWVHSQPRWSEPLHAKVSLGTRLQRTEEFAIGPPLVSFSYYHWLNEPVRQKIGLHANLQVVYASAVDPIIPLEWMHGQPRWSEPVMYRDRQPHLRVGANQDFIPQPRPIISMAWWLALAEPKRFRRRLSESAQQAVALQPPPVVIEWYAPLADPVRIKLGLPERLQMVYVSNIGPTPGRPYFKVNIIL